GNQQHPHRLPLSGVGGAVGPLASRHRPCTEVDGAHNGTIARAVIPSGETRRPRAARPTTGSLAGAGLPRAALRLLRLRVEELALLAGVLGRLLRCLHRLSGLCLLTRSLLTRRCLGLCARRGRPVLRGLLDRCRTTERWLLRLVLPVLRLLRSTRGN